MSGRVRAIDALKAALKKAPDPSLLTVEEQRQATVLLVEKNPPAGDVAVRRTTSPAPAGAWIETPQSDAGRIILYLHGGGFIAGAPETHAGLIGELCRAAGARAFAPDYRLAPETPFPAALEDSVAAYEFALKEGGAGADIAIAGDSAGGGLVLSTLNALRDRGLAMPKAAVLFSPWADLTCSGPMYRERRDADLMLNRKALEAMAAHYLDGRAPTDPQASPLFDDLGNLPPLLIQVGDAEVLLGDAIALEDKITAAGGRVRLDVWPEMVHVWQGFTAFLPEATEALTQAGAFLDDVWSDSE